MNWANLVDLYRRDGLRGLKRGLFRVFTTGQCDLTYPPVGVDLADYAEWVRRYATLSNVVRDGMRARIDSFAHAPLVSVVMSVSSPRIEWFAEAINSVRNQIYPHWELCIAECAPLQKDIRLMLQRYATEDSRIKVSFCECDEQISNDLSAWIKGEWVVSLGHEDLMAAQALFRVAEAANRNPDLGMMYADEDQVDAAGRRSLPSFKCDWNADLFYSQNFIGRVGVYRASLLRDGGGLRQCFDGAQDYDLALRCIEQLKREQIYHIPYVLYHLRAHSETPSPAENSGLSGETALNGHFQRQGVKAAAKPQEFGMYRVRYALPDNPPLVSLIIPTRNGLLFLRQCIDSIVAKTTYPNYEILIVDNGSDDPAVLGYFKLLESRPNIRVVRDDRPFNYSALNNAAVKLARGELLGLVNNDIEVIAADWLSEMVSHALRPDVGAVGARLWYPDDTLQHGGVVLGIGIGGVAGHAHKHLRRGLSGYCGRASVVQEFSAVTAACLVIRKAIYAQVGGLNETDLKIAFNDIDFCLRVREAGYRNIWTPHAELTHHESATRGAENTLLRRLRFAREMRYMNRRWGDLLRNDPAYSPNLSLERHDFSYAWPPRTKSLVAGFEGDTR